MAIGGGIGYALAPKKVSDEAVRAARLFTGGVELIDGRGEHLIAWGDIASLQGRHTQHHADVMPGLKIKGTTTHQYVLRTRDGTGYWLDDRIQNVAELLLRSARAATGRLDP